MNAEPRRDRCSAGRAGRGSSRSPRAASAVGRGGLRRRAGMLAGSRRPRTALGQDPALGRSELDRQRQPVEARDDLGDRRGRRGRDLRSRVARPEPRSTNRCTPSNCESSASVGRCPASGSAAAARRTPPRRGRSSVRGWSPGPGASARRRAGPRRSGRRPEVLEVVEHEQHVAIAQRVHDRLEERPFRGLADQQRRRDRRRQQFGFRDRGELDEERPVAVSQQPLRRDLKRRGASCRRHPARSASRAAPGRGAPGLRRSPLRDRRRR